VLEPTRALIKLAATLLLNQQTLLVVFLVCCRMNLHIMRMDKNSRLMQRALKLATTLPLNHPDFKNSIIEKLCKPNGYYQVKTHTPHPSFITPAWG
jgi:hypothetical protein